MIDIDLTQSTPRDVYVALLESYWIADAYCDCDEELRVRWLTEIDDALCDGDEDQRRRVLLRMLNRLAGEDQDDDQED